MLTRRQLLGSGIAAAAALALAGLAYEFTPDTAYGDPEHRFTILADEDRVILGAIAPVMLASAIRAGDVPQVVRGVDVAIAGLPLEVRAQVRQLFGVLRFPLTRMFVAGIWKPWHAAGEREIAQFLSTWRYSRIAQLRAAYDALHQLLMASWYGNTVSWSAIGYTGPPRVS